MENKNEYISDLQVMRSQAGWYVGRGYWDCEMLGEWDQVSYPLPYSRDSEYFPTFKDAEKYLNEYMGVGAVPANFLEAIDNAD